MYIRRLVRTASLRVEVRLSTGLESLTVLIVPSFPWTTLRSVPVTHALATEAAYPVNFEVIKNDRRLCSKGVFLLSSLWAGDWAQGSWMLSKCCSAELHPQLWILSSAFSGSLQVRWEQILYSSLRELTVCGGKTSLKSRDVLPECSVELDAETKPYPYTHKHHFKTCCANLTVQVWSQLSQRGDRRGKAESTGFLCLMYTPQLRHLHTEQVKKKNLAKT